MMMNRTNAGFNYLKEIKITSEPCTNLNRYFSATSEWRELSRPNDSAWKCGLFLPVPVLGNDCRVLWYPVISQCATQTLRSNEECS